jgi:hypothetical protein
MVSLVLTIIAFAGAMSVPAFLTAIVESIASKIQPLSSRTRASRRTNWADHCRPVAMSLPINEASRTMATPDSLLHPSLSPHRTGRMPLLPALAQWSRIANGGQANTPTGLAPAGSHQLAAGALTRSPGRRAQAPARAGFNRCVGPIVFVLIEERRAFLTRHFDRHDL